MAAARRLGSFPGRLVMLGFGSIGQAILPLLPDAFGISLPQIRIVTADVAHIALAHGRHVEVIVQHLYPGNYRDVLAPLLGPGDFLLNLSVDVSSLALVAFCSERGALYLDADNEPWPGRHDNPALPASRRSNYGLREEMLAFRREHAQGPTACITQGANPGLVNSLLKVALLGMASDLQLDVAPPAAREDWAALARRLQVKVIQVAERDTQVSSRRKERGEFVNTWSVAGFAEEGVQPAELGWGTHERHWPADGLRHGYGSDAAIMLERPGMATRVRSWTPLAGPQHGMLITHAEAISIAEYLSVHEASALAYRPTVYYAYRPCDDAVLSVDELAGRNWQLQPARRILRDEITDGMDELGVLVMGHPRGAYWYGSRLTIAQARAIAPCNNATSLQVVAGILGAMAWALRHPRQGVVEPDEIDHRVVMDVATPYLGELAGVWSDWTPLKDRSALFPEPADPQDPWQFLNFRVA